MKKYTCFNCFLIFSAFCNNHLIKTVQHKQSIKFFTSMKQQWIDKGVNKL